MRRLVGSAPRSTYARYGSSFAAGLFNYRIVPTEMFPFPSRKLDEDESESIQTMIEQIRKSDKDLGLAGARIATEYGGMGLSHTSHALLCEELGMSGDGKFLESIQHCGLASFLLSTAGSKEIKGKYLTAMSDGTVMMGWAVEENGSDISMNTTTATATTEGGYAITGTKRCVLPAAATHFIVLAKTTTQAATEEGPKEVQRNSFFVVEKSAKGVKVEGDSVYFEGTPAADVVGVVGEGFKDRMITIFTEQYVYAASLLGILKRIEQELRDTVADEWAINTVASCACTTYAMEAALYSLTANFDRPTEDSLLEAALVSAFLQKGINEWLNILATATPSNDALEKCVGNARRLLSMMESSDFLYSAAVCCGVEDYGLNFQQTSTLQMMQMRLARTVGMKDRVPVTDVDCSAIDAAVVAFGDAVEETFVRRASQVPQQQLIINRLGEAASLLYAASACASRASMCNNKNLPTAKTEKQLASIFITVAAARANKLTSECRNLGRTADDFYQRIALDICEEALR